MIKLAKASDINELWASVRPYVLKVLTKQHDWNETAVYNELASGRMSLWLIDDCAMGITQVQPFPNGKICVVFMCGGSGMKNWKSRFDEVVTNYARGMGCVAMTIHGRSGWERVYPDFERDAVVLRKQL